MTRRISTGTAGKRKRAEATDRPKKRARSQSSSESEDIESQILLLENGVAESKKNYNNIAALISYANRAEEDSVILAAAVSLCRIFIRLLAQGAFSRRKAASEKDVVVINWLRERLAEFKDALRRLLSREATCSAALTLSMRLLESEAAAASEAVLPDREDCSFPKTFLTDIVTTVLTKAADLEGLLEEFVGKFVEKYADVRYYTFKAVAEILGGRQAEGPDLFDGAFDLLSSFMTVPTSKDDLGKFFAPAPKKTSHTLYSVAQHKKQAQDAWVKLLNLGMDKAQRKKVLAIMSKVVAPWFAKPEMLMDFLTDSLNEGGSVSLLALSGVFYLMQERNLDYPDFYTKLYSLLDANMLHSKHRSRFFRLLDTFLSSSHLPAQLVASFIKRLARLCLFAPPQAIVATVPWFYNLFKKHPLCTFMLHRELRTEEERQAIEEGGMDDPFDMNEPDPMETDAIESCLWEIVQLQSHYHPSVATIAKIISEQFTKQFYNMEDFLDHSYSSLLENELSNEIKKAPVVEFQIPKKIFLPHEPDSGLEDSLLVKLWNFSG